MRKLRWNWPVWLGFVFSVVAFFRAFFPLRSTRPIHPEAPQKVSFSSFIVAIGDRFATPSYGVLKNSCQLSKIWVFDLSL